MQTVQDVQTWIGKTMVDPDGDKIGTIENVYMDRHTGEPAWAAVKTGLFGLKHSLVPIHDAQPAGDDEIRVPVQKEQVKDAPRVDPDDGLSPDEERRLWEHYGLSDYEEWQGEDRTTALSLPDEPDDAPDRSADAPGGGDAEPAVVGVRLRRIVIVAAPAGSDENGERG